MYKVVKLSMQCCGTILYGSFETYKFPRCIITEFECKVDVQNHELWVGTFSEMFF